MEVLLEELRMYGAMTYRKKSFYSSPEMYVYSSDIKSGNGDKYFREIGSQLVVDQSLIAEKVLDVRSLYNTEVMSK